MKLLSVFRKTVIEILRDPLALSLSLVFAPVFVLLYWLWFPQGGSTTYDLLVINNDLGAVSAGAPVNYGDGAVQALQELTYSDGKPMLTVQVFTDRGEAENRLRSRDAEALILIPEDFSQAFLTVEGESGEATVTYIGDLTNPYYPIALTLSGAVLDDYIRTAAGITSPIRFEEIALGDSAARSEFETYVPGLLIFAVIMMIFLAAMQVTREVEAGTLKRLALSRMSAFDLLGGITGTLLLVGLIEAGLTLAVALAFGFHTQGSLWIVMLVVLLTSFSIIGVGLVMSCFARSVNQAFLLANFPLGIFMFFSGAVFPVPRVELFRLGDQPVGLYDILPPTHAVQALNQVLNMGAGLGEIAYELTALTVLSGLYFLLGVWLFRKLQMNGSH